MSNAKFFNVVQLVKLLELREANHIEFCRIKNVVDEILHMNRNSELREILKLLMDPTWVATGLKIDFETLVSGCIWFFFFLHPLKEKKKKERKKIEKGNCNLFHHV